MIIDFHTHIFPDTICNAVIEKLSKVASTKAFTDGSRGALLESMKKANINYSVTLPVATNVAQVEKLNALAISAYEEELKQGLVSFGCMHPDYENYKSQLKTLKEHHIPGIKLHPAYQNTDLTDKKMLRILDACSELDLIVLIHSGIDIGLFDHNYASVKQLLEVVDTIHPPKLVLAHMGNWGLWDEVEAELAGAPVYFDTAFSIGAITPRPQAKRPPILPENLKEEQFLRIVRKHGSDKILFATDSPWEDQSDYVGRLLSMKLTEEERDNIMWNNAARLLFPQ